MSWFVKKALVKDTVHEEGADFEPDALAAHNRWQVIWPRVVAKAWADDTFHRELLDDAKNAIERHFGYALLGSLKFTVEDAPEDAKFDPAKEALSEPDDPWSALPSMELKMYLPPAPRAELQAIAITAYEDTGRTYPFTCC